MKPTESVRIDTDILAEIRAAADLNGRTIVGQLRHLLQTSTKYTLVACDVSEGRLITERFCQDPWAFIQAFSARQTNPRNVIVLGVLSTPFTNVLAGLPAFNEGFGLYCSDILNQKGV